MSQKTCSYARGSVCAVYGCKNYKFQKVSKSFFRMPRDLERLKKWIFACKRSDLDSLLKIKGPEYFYNNYVICSDHFDIECFRNKDLYSQGLLPNSIPTLNLYNVQESLKRKNRCEEKSIVDCATSSKKIKVNPDTEKKNEAPLQPIVCTLQQENLKLQEIIQEYKKNLNNKCSLLSKYRKKCLLLKQKLLQYKNCSCYSR